MAPDIRALKEIFKTLISRDSFGGNNDNHLQSLVEIIDRFSGDTSALVKELFQLIPRELPLITGELEKKNLSKSPKIKPEQSQS